ncbi:MAG: type 4a pilus biogenesis protein PilO [Patescibacteria group bacterium]|nr:type 4a pilus biogenesis protein PilO [Patescibacteria group bacterium]
MQKSNSGFYTAAAVMLTLASLFYTWKFILPSFQKTQGEIAQTNEEITAAKAKLDSLQSTKTSLDQLGDLVNKLFIAVPEDKDSPNLITELEAMAAKSKLIIPSIQISDSGSTAASTTTAATTGGTASTSNSGAIGVSFSITGDFAQLNQFLVALEKDIRFTNVKSLTLAEGKDGGLTCSIQVEVYKRVLALSSSTVAASAAGLPGVAQ